MNFTVDFKVDNANKLLICELCGETEQIKELEHLLKTIVKMAGKNSVKNVVVDGKEFKILCPKVEIAKLLITIEESDWLDELKIARIVRPELNVENVIVALAEKLALPIRNFETRSEAMLWLLFDKLADDQL